MALEYKLPYTAEEISKKLGDATAVSVAQTLTDGTEIGAVTINGTETKLFAPSKSNISVNNSQLVITT